MESPRHGRFMRRLLRCLQRKMHKKCVWGLLRWRQSSAKLTGREPSMPIVARCVIQGYVTYVQFYQFTCDDWKANMIAEFLKFASQSSFYMKSQMCTEVKFYFYSLTTIMISEEIDCSYNLVINVNRWLQSFGTHGKNLKSGTGTKTQWGRCWGLSAVCRLPITLRSVHCAGLSST